MDSELERIQSAIDHSYRVVDSLTIDPVTAFRRWLSHRRGIPVRYRLIRCTDGVYRDERLARKFELEHLDNLYKEMDNYHRLTHPKPHPCTLIYE